jgi:hypothetical protein
MTLNDNESPRKIGNKFTFSLTEYDTHSGWSSSNGEYTCPIQGIYRISWQLYLNSGGSIMVYKNTTPMSPSYGIYSDNQFMVGSTTVQCNAGDKLSLQNSGAAGGSSAQISSVSIERISAGSQVIASSEFVACSYYATSNTPQTSLTVTLKLPIRIYDTHGAWGTTTGQFTAPISGKYRVTLIGSLGGGQPVRLFKQNVSYCWIGNVENHSGSFTTSCDVDLLAGNVIDIRTSNGPITATAWTGGTLGDNSVTVISISRIGI